MTSERYQKVRRHSNDEMKYRNLNVCSLVAGMFMLFAFVQAEFATRPDVLWMRSGHVSGVGIGDIATSPDGQMFATTELGQIKLWRASDGRLLRTFSAACSLVGDNRIEFSPDNLHLLANCRAGNISTIRRMRITDGSVVASYGNENFPTTISWFGLMPGNRVGLIVAGPGSIKFFDYTTGAQIGGPLTTVVFNGGSQTFGPIVFPSAGRFLPTGEITVSALSIGLNVTYPVLINSDGNLIGYVNDNLSGPGPFTSFMPDGSRLAVNNRIFNRAQLCFPTVSCQAGTPLAFQVPGLRMFAPPNGQSLLAVTAGAINFHSPSDGSLVRTVSLPAIENSNGTAYSGDGQFVIAEQRPPLTSSLRRVPVIDDGLPIPRLETFYGSLNEVAFSPDGGTLATLSPLTFDSTTHEIIIRLFDSQNGSLLRTIPTGLNLADCRGNPGGSCLAFAPDGQSIYVAQVGSTIREWNLDGTFIRTIDVGGTRGFAISQQHIASIASGPSNNINLYDRASGSFLRTMTPPSFQFPPMPGPQAAATFFITFSPDGTTIFAAHNLVASGVVKGFLRSYTVATGVGGPSTESSSPYLRSVSVARDGQSIALAGTGSCAFPCTLLPNTGRVEIRSASTGAILRSFDEYSGTPNSVEVTPDGRYVVSSGNGPIRIFKIADGTLARLYDEELVSNGGINEYVTSLDVASFGSRFAYGRWDATVVVAKNPFGIATPFDFDGDGKTDIGIFRPIVGASEWWVNRSGNGQTFALQFGTLMDLIAPADYTGDGKTDIAFFRPSTGWWYVLRSEHDFSSFFAFPFGTNGDVPVPADYDADGKADFAVFRPSTSTWFISQSSGAPTRIEQFGVTGDQPVVADYDADGRADVGIFRPAASGAEWWVNRSSSGLLAMQFGASTDKPVQGDYTGDGKADVAIWRPSNGNWLIVRSEDFSFFGFPFGSMGDVVSPGDYDGDGKFDPTVWRPSSATWFSGRTTAGTLIVQFGATGDQPIPSAFVP